MAYYGGLKGILRGLTSHPSTRLFSSFRKLQLLLPGLLEYPLTRPSRLCFRSVSALDGGAVNHAKPASGCRPNRDNKQKKQKKKKKKNKTNKKAKTRRRGRRILQ